MTARSCAARLEDRELAAGICQRRPNFGSGVVSVVGLVGEQDAEAEQVGAGASVHLVFGVS